MTTPQAQSENSPWAIMQAMVNGVLIQTGHYFNPKTGNALKAQMAMKKTIPAALDRFHESLDELEKELYRAKAVMRRDLAVLQADRQKREQAEAAERQRVAAESSTIKEASQGKVASEDMDIVMADRGDVPAQSYNELVPAPQDTQQATPATTNATSTAPLPQPALITTTIPSPRDDLFDPSPTTGNPQETEIDFDFANDESSNTHADGNNADPNPLSPNLDFTLDDHNEPSLLRGLEDFANSANDSTAANPPANMGADADFSMLDIPAETTTTGENNSSHNDLLSHVQQMESAVDPQQQASQPQQQAQDDILDTMPDALPNDSNFDDLFNWDNENPEGTQFDDAFFGFEES
ncbi:hypothetical protein K432DRAFT_403888 [Lepidopterella palustris CBS 459.81]|uniref:Uncharacterized protein n=1 Tax=Lepidopterella palustris CBS 459.81 TaxID=1314670 RepID=A0A8E2ED30_9PEZI|nr:hypothetical protein K432DRAFT_403888 [Lepidopterella palustris CBS 459.81]